MNFHIINPLTDHRWDDLVARHPRASVFHQRGWIEALSATYGYEPLVLTSAPPGEPLEDGVVFCRVASWITGNRLVSLPFADHCEPLLNHLGEYLEYAKWLRTECDRGRWKYVELRSLFPLPVEGSGLRPSQSYCFHELDVRPNLQQIFQRFHKDSIQRRIRRAEKEAFSYEVGNSEELVNAFYSLVRITRKRQMLPPQPLSWFRNLVAAMGDHLEIRLLRRDETPVAAILTLRHRTTVVYKYGCSDERFHHFGVMPLLFWKVIEEGKAAGVERIDFGRSDLDRETLIAFKDKFGTTKRVLLYYRYTSAAREREGSARNAQAVRQLFALLPNAVLTANAHVMRQLFALLPNSVLTTLGKILYRHMG